MYKKSGTDPVNYENARKLAKYQIRMAGGAPQKNDVYKYKLNYYSDELSKNGYDVPKLIGAIQSGGVVQMEQAFKDQQRRILELIRGLGNVDLQRLRDQAAELGGLAANASQQYGQLSADYRDTMVNHGELFAGLYGDLKKKPREAQDLPGYDNMRAALTFDPNRDQVVGQTNAAVDDIFRQAIAENAAPAGAADTTASA